MISKKAEKRFWSKVDVRAPGDCWEWMCGKRRGGYGGFSLNRKTVRAHRVAYELAHGPIEKGLLVRHKCDNPACCNPNHLEVGTNADNMADMVARGRSLKGPENPKSKLSEADVLKIRDDPRMPREIADEYGVSGSTISRIKRGADWQHLPNSRRHIDHRAKLGVADVDNIRLDKRSLREIAAAYGISKTQASRIRRGESWNGKRRNDRRAA